MFSSIKRIYRIAGKEKKNLSLSIIISLFENMMIFVPYMLVFYFIHMYINEKITTALILQVALIMVASIVLRGILRRIIDGLQSAKGLVIFGVKREEMVKHLRALPMGYFSEGNIGNIVSILTTDMIFMEETAMTFFGQYVSAYLSIAISSIFMLSIHMGLGIVYIVIIAITFLAISRLKAVNEYHGAIRQEQFGTLSESVVQFIKGMETMKAFRIENEENIDLEKAFTESAEKAIGFEKAYLKPRLATEGASAIGTACMMIAALFFYFQGTLDQNYVLGMLIFSPIAMESIHTIISGITRFSILEAGLDRYDKVMEVEELHDTGSPYEGQTLDIAFHNVSFAYEEAEVLQNINLEIKEKTFTALVGPSGGGKSTITNLIARFWDVKKGEITLGGQDIRSISLENLLSKISMVFQNVYLFEDTIANNIAFGTRDVTKDEIIEVAKRARCHEFIMKLPLGYETMVGEGGATLSGGEKQRLSIARAILKDAPVVLLDEATSSVDPENEAFIQEAISELIRDKTLIVIAHKLSSIQHADQIIVIEDGKIVERGNHSELLAKKGLYNKLSTYGI